MSATSTEQVVDDDSPLGDCFGGVLSGEYVHCYILEQARSQGLIDVVAVYEVRDNWLFVSIRGDVSAELGRFVREKTKEFMYEIARTLKDASLPGGSVYGQYFEQGCPTSPSGPFPGCYVSYNIGDLNVPPGWFLPATLGYRYGVEFVPGGDAGRRQVVGWAGWRQVWPAVVSGASGVSGASTTFDVSDVDMTNLPDATSEHGFAGSKGGGVLYVQVKNLPTDPAALHTLRQAISPCYDMTGVCTRTGPDGQTRTKRLVFISVKYHWYELARWAEILDRLALSAGNTIGITGATVFDNRHPATHERIYVNGMESAHISAEGVPESRRVRTTILIEVRGELQRVADALPVLLPLLGIPVDAVGIVQIPVDLVNVAFHATTTAG